LDFLNPFACSWWWFEDFIEGYVQSGPDCTPVPRLVDSMEMSEDGLTWILHLRKGVTYSDGKPFNAYVLKSYWDWFTSMELKDWYATTRSSASWEAVDDYTFRFTTKNPSGAWGHPHRGRGARAVAQAGAVRAAGLKGLLTGYLQNVIKRTKSF
jgi:ABC-type transport system substrate-binding protein